MEKINNILKKDLIEYSKEYTSPYGEIKTDNENTILSENIQLGLDTKKTKRNLNTIVLGYSGTGKSLNYQIPNILQANTSYVILDIGGEKLRNTGDYLQKQGYDIQILNLINPNKSNFYNPFHYFFNNQDISDFIDAFIKNTDDGKSGGDPFWEILEKTLLEALFFYVMEERHQKDRSLNDVINLIKGAEIDVINPKSKCSVDLLMEDLKKRNPNSLAVEKWDEFRKNNVKALKSALISTIVRFATLGVEKFSKLLCQTETSDNEINLSALGTKKTAIFILYPLSSCENNIIGTLFLNQAFNYLYNYADNYNENSFIVKCKDEILETISSECEYEFFKKAFKNGKIIEKNNKYQFVYKFKDNLIVLKENIYKEALEDYQNKYLQSEIMKWNNEGFPHHIRFILDEFANIGQILDFDKKLATMHKYEMSAVIILQSIMQLEYLYEKQYKGMIDNCDTFLFLGSSELNTCTFFSNLIKIYEKQKMISSIYPDELLHLSPNECVVYIRNLISTIDEKYDFTKKDIYKETGFYNEDFIYDYNLFF